MKEKKESDSGGKAFGRTTGMAVIGLLLVFLLTGCNQERMETRREIDRIYKAAEQTAEDRAAAYITEKYGIDASTEGYWVQRYFAELYHLPQPYKTDIEFQLENAPGYRAATPAKWRERGFDHGNMVDFYFQGQAAEELLAMMSRMEFHNS